MRKIAFLPIIVLCIMPGLVSASDFGWLLDCRANKDGQDYYNKLNTLKTGAVPRAEVVAAIQRDLPNQFIGRDSECIFDVILFFGDESTVGHLKKRQKQPNRTDEPGYAEDLIRLLETRSTKYSDQQGFLKEVSAYRHPISIQHFLEIHLKDLPTQAQLAVLLSVIQQNKLPGVYHYTVPVFLEKVYAAAPSEYDAFVSSLSNKPAEFTCFKDHSCP